ncbi:MAG: tRNA 2-thiocytidine biosynthesis protein TtcA [Chloroflexi bacterium]|nr:tRNA 2-thiocytidine biosynthesis protein TtcA [Chloroflexota bacterium]
MTDSLVADDPLAASARLVYFLSKKARKATRDYGLIAAGDRIAVAVSGGKDSMALLLVLCAMQADWPDRFELCPVHVTPAADAPCGGGDPAQLAGWLEKRLGLPLELAPMEAAGQTDRSRPSPCFHCAWRRRKALFTAAARLGCAKVAMGHHADDVAQTTLMNLFNHGRLETMQPKIGLFEGEITLIRPLFFAAEREIVRLARVAGFPPAPAACTVGANGHRALMADVLRLVERRQRRAKRHLWRAVQRADAADGR